MADPTELQQLVLLTKLSTVYLANNVFVKELSLADYLQLVTKYAPRLTQLDTNYMTPATTAGGATTTTTTTTMATEAEPVSR